MSFSFIPPYHFLSRFLIITVALSIFFLGHESLAATNRSWTQAMDMYHGPITALAADNSGNVYAGTAGGLYKSNNGGSTWKAANTGLGADARNIDVLMMDRNGNVYVGTYGAGVYKSVNGGSSWSAMNTGMIGNSLYISALTSDSSGNLYAGTIHGGVYKNSNGSGSWSAMNIGLAGNGLNIHTLVIDSHGNLYAGTDDGVYKSSNNGNAWSAMKTGLTGVNGDAIRVFVLIVGRFDTLYAGTYGAGVYKFNIGDSAWSATAFDYGGINCLTMDSNGNLYAGTGNGLYESSDAGKSWILKTSTDFESVTYSIFYSLAADRSGNVYVGLDYDGGLYKINSDGSNWSRANVVLYTSSQTYKFAVDFNGNIYAGTYRDGIYKSVDSGNTWIKVNSGLSGNSLYISAIVVDNRANVYAAASNGSIYKSSSGGSDWSVAANGQLWGGSSVRAFAVDNGNNIYIGTYQNGVYKSNNAGENWSEKNTGLPKNCTVSALIIDRSGNIYAGTDGYGVYKSSDGGNNWSAMSTGLKGSALYVGNLIVDSTGNLYATTNGFGIYRNIIGSSTWSLINAGLKGKYISSLAADISDNLYVSTDVGVYMSNDGGNTWNNESIGLMFTSHGPDSLASDGKGNIYAGFFSDGIFKLTPTPWTTTLNATGALNSQTLSIIFTPDAGDLGKNGCVFFAAARPLNLGSFTLGGNGWQPFRIDDPTAYSIGPLTTTPALLASNTNLNGLLGTTILAGYGHGTNTVDCYIDMVKNQLYMQAYTIQ